MQLGASVNSLHAFAHSDDLGGTAGDFLETALDRGSLTRQRRLLIRMTMSSANQCRSYMAHLRCQLAGLAVAAKIAAISEPPPNSPKSRGCVAKTLGRTLLASEPTQRYEAPSIRFLAEATIFDGLRKAGMPEERMPPARSAEEGSQPPLITAISPTPSTAVRNETDS